MSLLFTLLRSQLILLGPSAKGRKDLLQELSSKWRSVPAFNRQYGTPVETRQFIFEYHEEPIPAPEPDYQDAFEVARRHRKPLDWAGIGQPTVSLPEVTVNVWEVADVQSALASFFIEQPYVALSSTLILTPLVPSSFCSLLVMTMLKLLELTR